MHEGVERMATSGRAAAQKIALAERQQTALSLRKSGASYRAIAAHIAAQTDATGALLQPKYSEGLAYRDIATCLKALVSQTSLAAEEYRSLELERLDIAQLAIAKKVQSGDLGSIDRWLRISERRSALLGLDAPVRLKIEQGVEAELSAFLNSLESVLPTEIYQQVLTAIALVETRAGAAANN